MKSQCLKYGGKTTQRFDLNQILQDNPYIQSHQPTKSESVVTSGFKADNLDNLEVSFTSP
jgi:hypothetical protein